MAESTEAATVAEQPAAAEMDGAAPSEQPALAEAAADEQPPHAAAASLCHKILG